MENEGNDGQRSQGGFGLGLDELGYILKTEYFEGGAIPHAEYLVSMSPGPAAGPAVLAALEAVIP